METKTKKILITGSEGFVGSELKNKLTSLGYELVFFDIHQGDISTSRINISGITHVFHLAAKTFVPESWKNTFDFYQTNIMGTVNVLEVCRVNACPLTYISSYVYGLPQYLPVDEMHPVEPASPYNHSKLVAENICKYYSKTFNIPVAIFRPVNIYGAWQNKNFLIPTILDQLFDNQKSAIEVLNLRPKRDYLYIDDFINALVASIKNKSFEIYNIGSGYSISVNDIINFSMNAAHIEKPVIAKNIERQNEVWDVFVDNSKIRQTLGWIPTVGFEEGIRKIIDKQYSL